MVRAAAKRGESILHWPSWHWPWHRAPPLAAVPVHVLDVSGTATPAQYWKRNTLLIDLSAVSGAGQLVFTPAGGGMKMPLSS